MNKILVVVDMQMRFVRQCHAENIVNNVKNEIEKRRQEGYDLIFTFDESGGDAVEEISEYLPKSKIYKKHSYGCKELILDLHSNMPDVIEFIGVCTDICVITNVLGTMAFLPYTEIIVDSRCCASEKEGHIAALKVMRACNITVV